MPREPKIEKESGVGDKIRDLDFLKTNSSRITLIGS